MDQDTQTVIDRLDEALALSGLSLRQFALALGTSPSRLSSYRTGKTAPSATFVFRALRIANALARARRDRVPSSLDAAKAIAKAASRGDDDRTYATLLETRDRLRHILRTTPDEAEAWEAQPSLDDARWGALLAAFVSHEFEDAGRPEPGWTRDRRLDQAWVLDTPRLTDDEVRAQTPDWLARRNIFVAPRDLVTV